jgi:excisionase family DNA binding protein
MGMHRNASEATTISLLLTVNEAADLLHLSVRYVRILMARGEIPVVRLGRRTLIRRTDLDALVAGGGLGGHS